MNMSDSKREQLRAVCLLSAVLLLVSMLALVGTRTAWAHAKVISANPAIGSTIARAPTTLTVTTAENMNPDPKRSYLQVYGPNGEMVSLGDSKIPLSRPTEMSVSLKPTGSGIYVVRWVTLSADDNESYEGAFVFTVNPQGAKTASVSLPRPSPGAASGTTGGVALWVPIASSVMSLFVGLLVGIAFGRRRTAPAFGKMRQAVSSSRNARFDA